MSQFTLYVLSDGEFSKVGVSSDFEKRRRTYKTHNPSFKEHSIYLCSEQDARRIEMASKRKFREYKVQGRAEWFRTPVDDVDAFVRRELEVSSSADVSQLLANQGVPVPEHVLKLFQKKVPGKYSWEFDKKLYEEFGKAYQLGGRWEDLENVLEVDCPAVDCRHPVRKESHSGGDIERFHRSDDHIKKYWKPVPLKSGFSVAVCTAVVSMPYNPVVPPVEKIFSAADAVGWRATSHPDWAWHAPGETGLFLYMPKTPFPQRAAELQKSFRWWVLENTQILRMRLGHFDQALLEKVLMDIRRDSSYPTHQEMSFDELIEFYRANLGIYWDSELAEATRPIYQMWQDSR